MLGLPRGASFFAPFAPSGFLVALPGLVLSLKINEIRKNQYFRSILFYQLFLIKEVNLIYLEHLVNYVNNCRLLFFGHDFLDFLVFLNQVVQT